MMGSVKCKNQVIYLFQDDIVSSLLSSTLPVSCLFVFSGQRLAQDGEGAATFNPDHAIAFQLHDQIAAWRPCSTSAT